MQPLPHEDRTLKRPETCLGADTYHTPKEVLQVAIVVFEKQGFKVDINQPFSGAIVPSYAYLVDPNVHSLLVEVRRDLYWDE